MKQDPKKKPQVLYAYELNMFKFGFSDTPKEDSKVHVLNTEWAQCEEVELDSATPLRENSKINSLELKKCNIKYLNFEEALQSLRTVENNAAVKAEENHSDLLPSVYEGGLKMWEGTYDLLNYLDNSDLIFRDKKVLDLGCGSGLVGIFASLQGATCWFQDYNKEVVTFLLSPNILINERNTEHCRMFSGDWESFSDKMEYSLSDESLKFDYIFTSETIYNTQCYPKLHKVFETFLKKDGVIYLAAKYFYFGVGGGVTLFENYLGENGTFKCEKCWEHVQGVRRVILKITYI